jgi:hypothetical protein
MKNVSNSFIVMPLSIILAVLTLNLTFYSCSKDDSETEPTEEKCVLEKREFLYEEYCGDDYYEESHTTNFYYDADDRVTKFEFEDGEYYLFFYDSNGKIERIEEHDNGDYEYYKFTWEGNKAIVRWYWHNETEPYKEIIHFNDENNIVLSEGLFFFEDDDEWAIIEYSDYIWQNGNLIKMEKYIDEDFDEWKKTNGQNMNYVSDLFHIKKGRFSDLTQSPPKNAIANFKLKSTNVYSYSDCKNPIRNLPLLLLYPEDYFYLSNNLVSSETFTFYRYNEEHTTIQEFTYECNDDNYPKIAYSIKEDGDCQKISTTNFKYNNCD